MELRTYLSFTGVVVASLALILRHSDYQWLLTTNKRHSVSPLKRLFEGCKSSSSRDPKRRRTRTPTKALTRANHTCALVAARKTDTDAVVAGLGHTKSEFRLRSQLQR